MSAARPRSFLSMFQVGLSVHMHRRLCSANAVNILHNPSFAASYKESKRYELSAMMSSTPEIIDSSFHQWIFDNADVNTLHMAWYGCHGSNSIEIRSSCNLSSIGYAAYLIVHQPFTSCPELFSMADRVTADSSINCEQAESLGRDAIRKLVRKSFNEVTLKRKDRVSSLATLTNTVKLNGEEMPINQTQLTNRILCMIKNENDLAQYITFGSISTFTFL